MKTSICVCIMLLMAWVISVASEIADRHFDNARELLNSGRYREAADEFDAIVKLSSSGSEVEQNARYWVGQCHFRMGEFDEALSTFEKLIQDYPESSITPVTQLMIARVEQEKENEKLRAKSSDTSDESVIIDPKTGLKYTKIRTLTGKNDVIKGSAWWISLSPNGRFLLWGKLVIPLEEGEPFKLVDMPASVSIWSPDGKKVILYSEEALWVVPVSPETGRPTGSARKLLDGEHEYRRCCWSSDSERIVFEWKGGETPGNIYTLSVKDGTLTELTNDPVREWRPIWSPDGKTIAYSRGYQLRVMPAEGGSSKMLVDSGRPNPISWSPDSEWLVYYWNGLRFLNLIDGSEFDIAPPGKVEAFLSWSSDGKKMLFYSSSYGRKSTLKVVSASGGPSFELGERIELLPYEQYWSPDSKMIVTWGKDEDGDWGFWVIPLVDGDPFPLEIDVSVAGKPEFLYLSPDCRKLAFAVPRGDETEDLYVVPVSVKDGRTTGPAVIALRGWDPKHSEHRSFSWSPDGTKMAVSHKWGIWIAPAEGGEPFQVRRKPGDRRSHRVEPAWSPDGKMIKYNTYYSDKERIQRVIPATGDENAIILDAPLGLQGVSDRWYQWSPDSKYLVFFSEGLIWAISITDGKSRQMFDVRELSIDDAWDFSWSPDMQKLAFIGYKKESGSCHLFTGPDRDGRFTEMAADERGDKRSVHWSPDGKWISYRCSSNVKTRPEGAIWEVDVSELLSGGEKKQ